MTRHRPLRLECLEDRLAPSTTGVTWPDGSHLTLSFVPDGTRVGSSPSNLFAALNAGAPTAAWQQAILRAFQAWAAPANLNVGVVPDGGQPLGTSGIVQGDGRAGPDPVLSGQAGHPVYTVSLYAVAAGGVVTRTTAFATDLLPERLAAADLNGAGLDDLRRGLGDQGRCVDRRCRLRREGRP